MTTHIKFSNYGIAIYTGNKQKRKQARELNYCSDYNTSHLLKINCGKLRCNMLENNLLIALRVSYFKTFFSTDRGS